MKSLKHYLAENEKTYEFRLRSVVEMTNEQIDKLEMHMKKYNVESVSSPKKTIMQQTPRGFNANLGPREVYITDISTKLPVTPATLKTEIIGICGISEGELIVNNKNEAEELWETEEDTNEEVSSVLADAEYKDSPKVDHSDYYGDGHIEKFVKAQPANELNKEYKV